MAEEGQVIACHKEAEWREHFERGKASGKLVVVDFTATWCGPCRAIAPIFGELAKTNADIIFLKVDVDELNAVSREWKIEAMPTFLFLVNGVEVDRIVGARKDVLIQKVELLKVNTTTATSTA